MLQEERETFEQLAERAKELGCAPVVVPVIERLNRILELLTTLIETQTTKPPPHPDA